MLKWVSGQMEPSVPQQFLPRFMGRCLVVWDFALTVKRMAGAQRWALPHRLPILMTVTISVPELNMRDGP